tara:strand:- start:452 stop:700 length:249 start_codon:yes stop_codon:yes gene_type:complete
MDKLDKAVARIRGEWPSDPIPWIYTTPDKGRTIYRAIRSDVCPEIYKGKDGQSFKQLYKIDDKIVGFDNTYGDEEKKYESII